jgi:hypothetical protein
MNIGNLAVPVSGPVLIKIGHVLVTMQVAFGERPAEQRTA